MLNKISDSDSDSKTRFCKTNCTILFNQTFE